VRGLRSEASEADPTCPGIAAVDGVDAAPGSAPHHWITLLRQDLSEEEALAWVTDAEFAPERRPSAVAVVCALCGEAIGSASELCSERRLWTSDSPSIEVPDYPPWEVDAQSGDESQAASSIRAITLSRGACYGECPVYEVTLRRGGSATWVGEQFTDRIGQFTGSIEPSDFVLLAELVVNSGFYAWDEMYPPPATDLPAYRLTVTSRHGERSVEQWGTDEPRGFSLIAAAVDGFASSTWWEPGEGSEVELHDPHGEADRDDRVMGALVGLAVGDCLGAGVEGWSPDQISDVYGTLRDFVYPQAAWTDDTQQALVLVECLVRTGGLDPEWVGRRFVEMSHLGDGHFGLHRGTGRGFRAAVREFECTGDWRSSGTPDRAGNGAAMRIAPVAAAMSDWSEDEFRRAIVDVSLLTHREVRALVGALAVARVAAVLLGERAFPVPKERGYEVLGDLIGWLEDAAEWLVSDYRGVVTNPELLMHFTEVLRHVWSRWEMTPSERLGVIEGAASERRGEHSWPTEGFVLSSVATSVVWTLGSVGSFEDTLVGAVNLGGDADTVGAMVGGMAGAAAGLATIPARWVTGHAGRDELLAWADALANREDIDGLPSLIETEERLCRIVRG